MDKNLDIKYLIQKCKNQHRPSQQLLFEHMYGMGYMIATRYTQFKVEADEVLSNAFLKVFTNICSFDTDFDFVPWFKKIIVNTAIDFIRSKRHQLSVVELNENFVEIADEDIEFDNQTDILLALQTLSPMYQAVFNLYVMEEYSHDEIGQLLNISPSTSRSNLARAKIVLKKYLLDESPNFQLRHTKLK